MSAQTPVAALATLSVKTPVRALAAILAAGYLRLLAARKTWQDGKTSQNPLDCCSHNKAPLVPKTTRRIARG